MLVLFDVISAGSTPELVASLDVSDNTMLERSSILTDLKDLYPGHTYYLHDCNHDTGHPCSQEAI